MKIKFQIPSTTSQINSKFQIRISNIGHWKLFGNWYLIFGISLLAGCVYYNTFYNAKRCHSDGMKEKKKSPSESVTPGERTLFESAIQKCEKIVTYHPKSKWVDDAIFLMSECFYEMEDYPNALMKVDELEIYFPSSPFLEEALFLRGRIYLKQKNYTAAIASLEGLMKGKSKYGEAAQIEILQVYFDKGEYEEVVQRGSAYLESASGGSKSPHSLEIRFIVAKALFEMTQFEEARKAFHEILQEGVPPKMVFESTLKIGESYLILEPIQVEKALETFATLLSQPLASEEKGILNLKIGRCHRLLGNFEEGVMILEEVPKDYPRSEEASEAYYEMGIIYEENLLDLEKAQESYKKVSETYPLAKVAKDAQLRSTAIGKLIEYQKKLTSAENDSLAEIQFLLAELYLLELRKIDQAISAYEKVVLDFPESEYSPRASYAIAWIFHHLEQDTTKAKEAYLKVISTYPETRYAKASKKAIEDLNSSD